MKESLRRLGSVATLMAAVCVFAATIACNQNQNKSEAPAAAAASESHPARDANVPEPPSPDIPTAPRVNGTRAMQYTKEVTAFGARPIGSANHKKLEEYIVAHLKGDQVEDTIKKIRAFLLADMIGDADLNIERETNSTPWLEDLVYQAATKLGYQSHFYARTLEIEDDHLQFVKLGVPCADIIDLDYGYNNVFHHSVEDTMDKLSPGSLQIAGDVILQTVWMLDAR